MLVVTTIMPLGPGHGAGSICAGSDPGPSYNLARTWARYGSDAGGPSVGAIVVWRHHVGKIVGHENG
jgi:hypothetical protein